MLAFLINALPVEKPGLLAECWSRNFASFCYQAWCLADAPGLVSHFTTMLRTSLRDNQQAYVVAGHTYVVLTGFGVPHYTGIVSQRHDPWHTLN